MQTEGVNRLAVYGQNSLAFQVRAVRPDPVFGRTVQQVIAGPCGPVPVAVRYVRQSWEYRGRSRHRDMILSVAQEEIEHVELLVAAVAANRRGESEPLDGSLTDWITAAQTGIAALRSSLGESRTAAPAGAHGVENGDVRDHLVPTLRANVAAEAAGCTLVSRLLAMTDDQGMQETLGFLLVRDALHQARWLAALGELDPRAAGGAPSRLENRRVRRARVRGGWPAPGPAARVRPIPRPVAVN